MKGAKLDCGGFVAQEMFFLDENTYIDNIYTWFKGAVPRLFVNTLELLEKNKGFTLKYTDADSSDSFRCYPRRPEDGRMDWNNSAENIHRLIRASGESFAEVYCFYKN